MHGYASFDPDLRMAGVVLNKIGGDSHAAWLKQGMSSSALTSQVSLRPVWHLAIVMCDEIEGNSQIGIHTNRGRAF